MIIEKVKLGLENSNKKSGVKKGSIPVNKKEIPEKQIKKHSKKYDGSLNNTELAKMLGCSRTTLIKWFKEIESK